ncbi:MAG: RNA 2',3'-cyclic phosphodiesterase [Pseudomonadota bacterium]
MIRCFLAIAIPEEIADAIDDIQNGLRNANWVPAENLHITLSFLGDLDRHQLGDLDAVLSKLTAPRVSLTLAGVGSFGGRDPRLVFANVAENADLRRLQAKVETAVQSAEIEIETRRYTPHVTLARWRRGEVRWPEMRPYVEAHNLFRSNVFDVDAYHLYRSELGRHGPSYEIMASYPLAHSTGS